MNKSYIVHLINIGKSAVVGSLLLTAIYVSFLWITGYSSNSQAAQEKVDIKFVPPTGNYNVNEEKTINIILSSKSAEKRISGFTLTLENRGVLDILSIEQPKIMSGGSSDEFTVINKTSRRITAVMILEKNRELPKIVRIPVIIKANKKGAGNLSLKAIQTEVVGNIAGSVYDLEAVESGNFTFK